MRKRTLIALATVAIAALALVAAQASLAQGGNDGRVEKRGNCTRATDWKLKAKPDDGRIEVEFEVDQNRVGKTWSVVLKDNGVRFFKGTRVTKAPSGSFEVERRANNKPGADRITAKATNQKSGEVCKAAVTL
jgi:hypothetical protein